MLKTLRIASILTVAAAAVVSGGVGFVALRPDPQIQDFLNREGVVEQFRGRATPIAQKEDTISPLEASARAFALRIDPPPPPKPPKPPSPPPDPKPAQPPVDVVKPPQEIRRPQMTAKFTLVATARYPDEPERSMALLKSVQNEFTWYRQGDPVGHLELHEVRDGSVVLYQGGQLNSEIFMPNPPTAKSLLKGDESATGSPGPSTVTVTTPPLSDQDVVVTTSTPPESPSESERRTIPSRLPTGQRRPVASRNSAIPSRPVRTAPQPTPEEQKASIEESISSIQEIMNAVQPVEGQSEEAIQQEQESWKQLISILEYERDNIAKATGETPEKPESSEESESGEEKPDAEEEKSGKIR